MLSQHALGRWQAGCVPSDSATTTVKNLMAPLTSLNQLQLKLKKMEDLVTTAVLSLTRVLGGGTGGPAEHTAGGVRVQFDPSTDSTPCRT